MMKKLLPGVKENVSLSIYTSFKIGGRARYFFAAKNKEDLIRACRAAKAANLPFFVLGGGTNVLVADKGFNGLVIKMQNTKYRIQNTNIIAAAGVALSNLANVSAQKGLTGFEWAAGIPGTLGGAVRGNAGAFGGCMAKVVKKAKALDCKTLKIKKINNAACQFGYRESVFKKKRHFIVIEAELNLKIGEKKQIMERVKTCLDYRKQRHPKEPSAGSTFKNVPIKIIPKNLFEEMPEAKNVVKEDVLPTAFLIAKAGLVGKKIGGAEISSQHPNFIINRQNASSDDIKNLIKFIKKTIKNKFGIELKEEIQFL